MSLNHELQCQILKYLQPFYSSGSSDIEKQEFTKHPEYDKNLKYLYESHFIKGINIKHLGTTNFELHSINITKAGLDFVATNYNQSKIQSPLIRRLRTIWLKHWKFLIGTILTVIGLYLAYLQLIKTK